MKKTTFLGCLFIISLVVIGCSKTKQDKERSSILFVSINDLRPSLGVYDDTVITPHRYDV